jgi:hypothetical protein
MRLASRPIVPLDLLAVQGKAPELDYEPIDAI